MPGIPKKLYNLLLNMKNKAFYYNILIHLLKISLTIILKIEMNKTQKLL